MNPLRVVMSRGHAMLHVMAESFDHQCPICGQGGLLLVRLLDLESKVHVLCAECEAIWEGGMPIPSQPTVKFEDYAAEHAIEPNWHRVEIVETAV